MPAALEKVGEWDLGALWGSWARTCASTCIQPQPFPGYLWVVLPIPVCCTLFGPSTSVSSAGPREVRSTGHCLQNTNSLGALVWGRGRAWGDGRSS